MQIDRDPAATTYYRRAVSALGEMSRPMAIEAAERCREAAFAALEDMAIGLLPRATLAPNDVAKAVSAGSTRLLDALPAPTSRVSGLTPRTRGGAAHPVMDLGPDYVRLAMRHVFVEEVLFHPVMVRAEYDPAWRGVFRDFLDTGPGRGAAVSRLSLEGAGIPECHAETPCATLHLLRDLHGIDPALLTGLAENHFGGLRVTDVVRSLRCLVACGLEAPSHVPGWAAFAARLDSRHQAALVHTPCSEALAVLDRPWREAARSPRERQTGETR